MIPATVNGKPLTSDSLGELVKSPRGGGNPTQYGYYAGDVQREHGGTRVDESYWVLVTNDVLEGSRSKSFEDQQSMVAKRSEGADVAYGVPKALEAAVLNFVTLSLLIRYFSFKIKYRCCINGYTFYHNFKDVKIR